MDAAVTLERIDPAEVVIGENIRKDPGNLDDLIASIRSDGVQIPISCHRDQDGKLILRTGQRRVLAAREAGQAEIPALVTEHAGERGDLLIEQWLENETREAMANDDRIEALNQMALEGMSDVEIAKRTGLPRTDVAAAAKIKQGSVTRQYIELLTFEQAAIITEFEDNEGDVEELVATAAEGEGEFNHAVENLRARRRDAQALEALREEAVRAGQIAEDKLVDYYEALATYPTMYRICWLYDSEGNQLTPEAHATCPGHVAWAAMEWHSGYVDGDGNEVTRDRLDSLSDDERSQVRWESKRVPELVYGCNDPGAYGHKRSPHQDFGGKSTKPRAEMSDGERADLAAQRREVIENNRAWPLATEVRRKWLREFIKQPKASPGVEKWIAQEMTRPDTAYRASEYAVADMLETSLDALHKEMNRPKTTTSRALHLTACILLARYEPNLRHKDDWRTVRDHCAGMRAALLQMQTWGYTLSEVEQKAVTNPKK